MGDNRDVYDPQTGRTTTVNVPTGPPTDEDDD